MKAGSSCVIIDSATKKTYTRRYRKSIIFDQKAGNGKTHELSSQIVELEDKIRGLEQRLRSRGVELDQHLVTERNSPGAGERAQFEVTNKRSPGRIPRFIGDESGTGCVEFRLLEKDR